MGGHVVGDAASRCVKLATGFGGGVGGSRQEMCGALTGAVMVIGAVLGRTRPGEDGQPARDLAARYRERFLAEFGSTQCAQLRDELIEAPGGWGSCDLLVERAAETLLEVLGEVG